MKNKVLQEGAATAPLDIADCVNRNRRWSGDPVQSDSLTSYRGRGVGICNPGCRDQFESAIRHFEKALAKRTAQ